MPTSELANKKIVVTGGGTGIGRACAIALAKEGAQLVISGRREDKLLETAAASGPGVHVQTADVADCESVHRLFAKAKELLGDIDILVNCSGINVKNRSITNLSLEDWKNMLDINATGAFHCMSAALPGMRARRDGLIINICSVAGKRANALAGVGYSASKFALNALTMTAALEEGKNGIRITSIHPGEVDTPILENRPTPLTAEHKQKILQPEDVAAAVVMIAKLPPRAHVSELIIKPTVQEYA